MKYKIVVFLLVFSFCLGRRGFSADKIWNSDTGFWEESLNWYPASIPQATDDITIDNSFSNVTIQNDFSCLSLTLGGHYSSNLLIEGFVFGEISSGSVAINNRRDGFLTLKGAGIITLKGSYKSSEEILEEEPSFIFWVQ